MKTINNLLASRRSGQLTINKKGFTLIELLVAISIIGILSSFLLANFVGVRQRARDGVRKSDLRQIQSALELYRSDQGVYPSYSCFLCCGNPLRNYPANTVTYMQKIPCDPLSGQSYWASSDGTTYTITACLENGNDSQKDSSANSVCVGTGKTGISYTLQNP